MYLLDTHVLLWWLTEPNKISNTGQQIIANRNNTIFISSISFWEMSIKNSLGKLTLPNNILTIAKSEGLKILPLQPEEGLSVADLPNIHQDPFDRILIAQAKYNNLVLITRDKKVQEYPIVTVLA
ncbi:MAG: type II toxin-antitoxin system VapC family toxin [Pseudomonadota bacterium]